MSVNELYSLWMQKANDPEIAAELAAISGDEEAIGDRFYQWLTFGTAGLRGVLGAGTNRMNIYTVGLASQAMAQWICAGGGGSVAIGYDSRIKSDVFAKTCAAILAANGVKAYLYAELQPTPLVSFAVRRLHCRAGVVITASHNPSKYNGFKAYGPDGYQMTDDDAHSVEQIMGGLDCFDDVRFGDYDALLESGMIELIGQDFVEGYLDEVQKACVDPDVCRKAGLRVIYTPLCGAGNKPVRAILSRIGIDDVTVVKAQEQPDGNFPYAPYPNPEIREAFTAALIVAANIPCDLLLATDPDSDRVGIAVRSGDGYELMTGNEVGAMMVQYLLERRKALGTLPERGVAIKSIVTSSLADALAADYGCEMRTVLTGFKYIGEIVTELEAAGEVDRFILGYEESYGYLIGSHARDKDAVVASMIICEMASYYKLQGKSLLEVMDDIYKRYGYYRNRVIAREFDGEAGMKKMAAIMDRLRADAPNSIAGAAVVARRDYLTHEAVDIAAGTVDEIKLPASNVLEYRLDDGSIFIVRPSGTEPKIKFYLTAAKDSESASDARLDQLQTAIDEII